MVDVMQHALWNIYTCVCVCVLFDKGMSPGTSQKGNLDTNLGVEGAFCLIDSFILLT